MDSTLGKPPRPGLAEPAWPQDDCEQAALQRGHEHLTVVLDATGSALWQWEPTRRATWFSRGFCAMLGWPPEEFRGDFDNWSVLVHPADWPAVRLGLRRIARARCEVGFRHRFRMRCRGQGWRWVLVRAQVVGRDARGRVTRIIGVNSDVTALVAAERAQSKSEAKFAAVFALTPDPMAVARRADGMLLEVSRSFGEYFGYTVDELVGRSFLGEDLGLWPTSLQCQLWRQLLAAVRDVRGYETELRRRDGSLVTASLSGKSVELDGDSCVILTCQDLTGKKAHAAQLEQTAYHDPLTGLPNRLLLGDRLRQAIAHNERAGSVVAVCYLDLDGFKAVNDRLGHEAGDRLLMEVASRLKAMVRGGDTVARLGGDEFVLLLSGLQGNDDCCMALDRILRALSEPYAIVGSGKVEVSASIGVTVYPGDHDDPDTLVRHADHAMYAAKQAGKNRYQLFDTHLEQRLEARHATLKRIAKALAEGQFRLHYQPKVDCRRGRVVGAEALLRWQHPTLGLLAPSEFLPLFEDDPLSVAVGDWVLREALSQLGAWRRGGLTMRVSVNAFARQLHEPGFVKGLAALLADRPEVTTGQLEVEIVETAALAELDAVRRVIEECAALGVHFSLDDFGTGYSSLVYLRHLPAREIKIDQSFVRNMLTDEQDLAIVEAVIGLSRAFRHALVAEGVETAEHVRRLLALGCDVMQGYALARPMAPDEFARWVHAFRPDPAWFACAASAPRDTQREQFHVSP